MKKVSYILRIYSHTMHATLSVSLFHQIASLRTRMPRVVHDPLRVKCSSFEWPRGEDRITVLSLNQSQSHLFSILYMLIVPACVCIHMIVHPPPPPCQSGHGVSSGVGLGLHSPHLLGLHQTHGPTRSPLCLRGTYIPIEPSFFTAVFL